MSRSLPVMLALIVAVVTVLFVPPRTASAQAEQSLNEVKQENNRLREQVADLDARLAEAQRRISRLEETIRALRRQLAGSELQRATSPAEDPASPGAPAESDPESEPSQPLSADAFAAPDAMHAALVRDYAQAFDGKPRQTAREADRYVQDVRRWARQAGLERRKQVDWVVRVLNITPASGRETEFVLEVIDPQSNLAIGSPFKIAFGGPIASRLQARPDQDLWLISGVFAAAPAVNPARAEPGLFNVPRFIGPYAEFGFSFSPKSIRPLNPDEQVSAPEERPPD